MGRAVATFGGVLILALVAGGLTEATLAFGRHGSLTNDALLRPLYRSPKPTPSPTSSPVASPSVTPVASATPSITPAPTPVIPRATTNSFVHMRAGKSTSTTILIDLNGGTVVDLLPDQDAQWQQIRYQGLSGYIYKTYLSY